MSCIPQSGIMWFMGKNTFLGNTNPISNSFFNPNKVLERAATPAAPCCEEIRRSFSSAKFTAGIFSTIKLGKTLCKCTQRALGKELISASQLSNPNFGLRENKSVIWVDFNGPIMHQTLCNATYLCNPLLHHMCVLSSLVAQAYLWVTVSLA